MNRLVSLILPYYNRKNYIDVTLDSFSYLYWGYRDSLQIVIVDDKSNDENRLEELVDFYSENLRIKLIRIENKKGINPCYPINVGVRQSDGDIIMLSSPEIFHTKNMFDVSNNFEKLSDDSYLQFSVFCITDKGLIDGLFRGFVNETIDKMNHMNKFFYEGLGLNGYGFANQWGSWYTHSKIATGCYNFLSACTRKTYYDIGGFNEAYINGTGYDDTDFRDRLLRYINNNVIWYDDFIAIHINHPAVSNDNNTNFALYSKLKGQAYEKNDDWGRL